MKITEIITERNNPNAVGNETAKIARSAKDAVKAFKTADKGALSTSDDKKQHGRKVVRQMYGVELVDDFIDVLELPNGHEGTDKEMSMFSKDNR